MKSIIIFSLSLIATIDSMAMGTTHQPAALSKIGRIEISNQTSNRRLPLRAIVVHRRNKQRHWTRSIIASRLEWTAKILNQECAVSIPTVGLYDLEITDHHYDLNSNASFEFLQLLDGKLDVRKIAGIFGNDGVQTLFYLDDIKRIDGSGFGYSGPESFFPNDKDLWNKAWIPSDVISSLYFSTPPMGVELHELGHNLLNDGDHWDKKNGYNIMLSDSIFFNPEQHSNQFTRAQCEKIAIHRSVLQAR